MRSDFDNLRRNLAESYNRIIEEIDSDKQGRFILDLILMDLRNGLVGLLCLH